MKSWALYFCACCRFCRIPLKLTHVQLIVLESIHVKILDMGGVTCFPGMVWEFRMTPLTGPEFSSVSAMAGLLDLQSWSYGSGQSARAGVSNHKYTKLIARLHKHITQIVRMKRTHGRHPVAGCAPKPWFGLVVTELIVSQEGGRVQGWESACWGVLILFSAN